MVGVSDHNYLGQNAAKVRKAMACRSYPLEHHGSSLKDHLITFMLKHLDGMPHEMVRPCGGGFKE